MRTVTRKEEYHDGKGWEDFVNELFVDFMSKKIKVYFKAEGADTGSVIVEYSWRDD